MPTREDVELAAQLVHRGILDRESIQRCLGELSDGAAAGRPRSLVDLIRKKQLVEDSRIDQLRLELALEQVKLPDLFPGYRIEKKIGEGGMSWVFKARRQSTGRSIALKVLRPAVAANPRLRAQFLREAKLLKSLRHENVLEGYEVGRIKGFYFLSMEFVDGESLLWHIDRKMAFNEDAALYVIMQIARALEHLRERGIVHRDVKPGNILLTGENTVKLCDLGLAATSEDRESDDDITVGTVEYLSPEQARGHQDLDVRSDIYSLGGTLYHLVLGRLPFEGCDNREIMAKQILESLSSPEMKQKISPHMHYFIEKMMAKEREFRYQSPLELIRDIESQIKGKKTMSFNPRSAADGSELEKPFSEGESTSGRLIRKKRGRNPSPPKRPRNKKTRSRRR